MPAAYWPFGDTTATMSGRTHRWEAEYPQTLRMNEGVSGGGQVR